MQISPRVFIPTPAPQVVQVYWYGKDDSSLPPGKIDLEVTLEPKEDIGPPRDKMQTLSASDGQAICVAETDHEFWLWRPGISIYLHLLENRGVARLSGRSYWDNVLRVIFFQVFLHRGGLLVHAAGLVHRQRAFIFPGPSGAGKTTIVSLSPKMAVLSDEIPVLQLAGQGREPVAHGTPFYGDWGRPGEEISAPIKGFYFPTHAQENRLIPLDSKETFTRLLPCVFSYTTRRPNLEILLNLTWQLAERVPGYVLSFCPDPGFWELLDGS
jgi:hypothetical protein